MIIEKYKPKYHHNPDNCTDDCEKDCSMECDICGATPWDTKFYYIIEGENNSPQFCEKCFGFLKLEIFDKYQSGSRVSLPQKAVSHEF